MGLLSLHVLLVLLFAQTRWTRPSRRNMIGLASFYLRGAPGDDVRARGAYLDELDTIADRVTPEFITTTLLASNAIGMLCARSLHYQFYSWLVWSTPYLLWKSGLHPALVVGVWGAQEWAWNQYPSTNVSSGVVVGCLLVQVMGVWWGSRPVPLATGRVKKE